MLAASMLRLTERQREVIETGDRRWDSVLAQRLGQMGRSTRLRHTIGDRAPFTVGLNYGEPLSRVRATFSL